MDPRRTDSIPDPSCHVVVGGDIGGTTTRVAVADLSGTVLAEARGGPGNPARVGLDPSIAVVSSVVRRALDVASTVVDRPVTVTHATLGLAGVTTLVGRPGGTRFGSETVPGVTARLVSDFAVAFASGSWQQRGVVTIAGTGSGAIEVDGGQDVARRDGWGWLLGDEGSGHWLGREAVRLTLSRLERGAELGRLGQLVTDALDAHSLVEVVATSYRREPARLSELAPLVTMATEDPEEPDPDALDLLTRAAGLVSDRVLDLWDPTRALPVVLAGSLVTGSGPLAEAVRRRLVQAGVTDLGEAGDGLAGALWLALRATPRPPAEAVEGKPSPDTGEPARQWSELLGSLGRCRSINSAPLET